MRICSTPNNYYNCNNLQQRKVNFEGTKNSQQETNKSYNVPALLSYTLVVAAGAFCAGYNSSSSEAQREYADFANRIATEYQSDEIQKDSFMVKDVNNDKSPEIILFTKDNKKVAFDLKNQKILDETQKDTTIVKPQEVKLQVTKFVERK